MTCLTRLGARLRSSGGLRRVAGQWHKEHAVRRWDSPRTLLAEPARPSRAGLSNRRLVGVDEGLAHAASAAPLFTSQVSAFLAHAS